jgi:hypothetical protein
MTQDNWIDMMIEQGKYPSFKRLYNDAVSEGKSDFEFESQYVLVPYAKYVCKYVDEVRGNKDITA